MNHVAANDLAQTPIAMRPAPVVVTRAAEVPLDNIRMDGATQARVSIDMATVERYAALISAGGTLPAIELVFDGTEHSIVDGHHRVCAYRRAGHRTIPATVVDGTRSDAVWRACAANNNRGLKRTNADKQRAVTMALLHPKGATMSDHSIAEHCGVHQTTVGRVRSRLVGERVIERCAERLGKDGRTRNTSNIGHTIRAPATSVSQPANTVAPTPMPKLMAKRIREFEKDLDRVCVEGLGHVREWEKNKDAPAFATRRFDAVLNSIWAKLLCLEQIARACEGARPSLATG